jgi:hypothetical protein
MIDPAPIALGALLVFNLFVLKYGPVPTKVLYIIISTILVGKYLSEVANAVLLGNIIEIIGVILLAPYLSKGITNLTNEF